MGKPSNWNKFTPEQKQQYAKELLVSVRAHTCVGKALAYAVTELRKVDAEYREYSDIEDMEILAMNFEPYYSLTMDFIASKEK
jgi:hypothetical protein